MSGTSKKNENGYVYTNDEYTYTYDYNQPLTITTSAATSATTGYVTTGSAAGQTYATYDSTWNTTDPTQDKILERLEAIEKRLTILPECSDKDNAALKDAYDHYKFIEKLIEGEENELGKDIL